MIQKDKTCIAFEKHNWLLIEAKGQNMQGLRKNIKGAVTVFVTFLLIPAILISGTAVDLARLHTARSILHDANQLAANSVLTQYNALLQDLYGLYGFAQEDPILANLVDEYIKVAVFGEPTTDKSLGTLQLFYGSDISSDTSFKSDFSLENEVVLRRQIEEYMKFRGPVLIVKEILDALESNNLKADKEIIEKKAEIDEQIAMLHDKYSELYEAILVTDRLIQVPYGISSGSFGTISTFLTDIREQFIMLYQCYKDWESLTPPEPPTPPIPSIDLEEAENDAIAYEIALAKYEYEKEYYDKQIIDLPLKYNAIMGNIKAIATGGSRGRNWSDGKWSIMGTGTTGITYHIEQAKEKAHNYKVNFDSLVRIAAEIDAANNALSKKIDELEKKLENNECSDELKQALTEKYGSPAKSVIDHYRDILK